METRLFGASGGEFLSRWLTRDASLAVLVLSSRPPSPTVHYLQYGALDYLPKPLDLPGWRPRSNERCAAVPS